jgi:hypothetical protein
MIYAYRTASGWVGPVSLTPRHNGVRAWHTLTDEQRAVHGWYPLIIGVGADYNPRLHQRTKRPISFTLTDGIVHADYGQWNKPLSQIISERCAEVDAERAARFWGEIPYTFPGDDQPDAIQFRDDQDRQNIQDTVIEAQARIASGDDTPIHFMPVSNQLKTLTPQQAVDMGLHLKHRGEAVYQTAWVHKATLRAMADIDAVLAYDINAGWPE